jgi:hypothetical protein
VSFDEEHRDEHELCAHEIHTLQARISELESAREVQDAALFNLRQDLRESSRIRRELEAAICSVLDGETDDPFDFLYTALNGSAPETACEHPMNMVNYHGSVSGVTNDFRCTVCNAVFQYTARQAAQWDEIREGLNAARECAAMNRSAKP